MSARLEVMAVSPPGFPGDGVAAAADRAGFRGVISLEYYTPGLAWPVIQAASGSIAHFGVAVFDLTDEWLQFLRPFSELGLTHVVLTEPAADRLAESISRAHSTHLEVFVVSRTLQAALHAQTAGADAVILKGCDAGGLVGEETTFILLQRVGPKLRIPFWAFGGVGLHSAAACLAGGAAGVVLDWQLALCRESQVPSAVRAKIARMDGSETAILGQELGQRYRAFTRPGETAFNVLRELEDRLTACGSAAEAAGWSAAVAAHVGPGSKEDRLLLVGQDAAFAGQLSAEHVTVGGICRAIVQSAEAHCRLAARDVALQPGGPLAASHGTTFPIMQGPMTRVSDTADFALAVAEGGGLPFLALALLRGPQVAALLQETKQKLGGKPWGVGILGFVPRELREEQLAEVRKVSPPYALIAGGRPDQAAALEQEGIHTYLHVPSPALLKMFLEGGARRVIFEGRECGGHVGPRTSFVLWELMVQVILEHLDSQRRDAGATPQRREAGAGADGAAAQNYHVVFAGGVHDARSAAMVAALAAPLSERGVRIGVLMGTSYLFTREAVTTGAILPGFQRAATECDQTILLETGVGHSTRCADTEFGQFFAEEKRRLIREGKSKEEIRDALERLNLGRLRIASKGITRAESSDESKADYVRLDEKAQRSEGMYMIGQVAALRDRTCTIAELHDDVSRKGAGELARFSATRVDAARRANSPSDVAIVGMSCMFPKAAEVERFWENLCNKVNAITEIPEDRWNWELYFNGDRAARDKIYSKWGGFLDDQPFDPTRYGMPPNSLSSIEPLQLLVLEAVRQALSDSGYDTRSFDRQRASVILGAGGGVADLGLGYGFRALLPYFMERAGGDGVAAAKLIDQLEGSLPEWTEDSFAGLLMNVAAGRVANRFDFGGTNYTVDAACASSLAAVRLAVQELESGSSDMVVVGGADTMQSPFAYLCFSKTQALSPTGRCKTFDESGDGIVISEGIAMVVLKRLDDARRDGDRIYAVIKGVGSSSDGKDKGLTAPRPAGQMRALERAYSKAGFDPTTVGLVEAHGTGTVAGDQSEVESLTRSFTHAGAETQGCALGSVKSLIGHTKCTAGVAGMLKAALALHRKTLPPTDGVKKPNPKAKFEQSPFYVNTETRPWVQRADGTPRRAGVSAFGFGGTNFHAVLEEFESDTEQPGLMRWPAELFLWQCGSPTEIAASIEQIENALAQGAAPLLADLAAAVCTKFSEPLSRLPQACLAIVAESLDDLASKLRAANAAITAGRSNFRDPKGIYYSASRERQPVAMLFPGQGSQGVNMLRDLALAMPCVRQVFEQADRAIGDTLDKPLSRFIYPHPKFTPEDAAADETALTATNVAQPALGAAGAAMLALLRRLGVRADMGGGHSYGEYVALYAAGVLTLKDLIRVSEARGRFIAEAGLKNPGAMAAVSGDEATVSKAIAGSPGVSIANLNGPGQTVIAGGEQDIDQAVRSLNAIGLATKKIRVSCAFHSERVQPAQAPFAVELDGVDFRRARFPVYSNTTAVPHAGNADAVRRQLVEHLVRPVRFSAEIEAMYAAGARIFVEVGPGRVLSGLVQRTFGERAHTAINLDQPGRNGLVQLAHAVGQLAVAGGAVDAYGLFEGRVVNKLDLSKLVEQSRPAPLSPTTWMVNGARAVPLRGQPARPKHTVAATSATTSMNGASNGNGHPASPQSGPRVEPQLVKAAVDAHAGNGSAAGPKQPSGHTINMNAQEENGFGHALATAPMPLPSIAAGQPQAVQVQPIAPPTGAASVMNSYHELMGKFLESQKNVMLAFLQGQRAGGVPSTATAGMGALPAPAIQAAASPVPSPIAASVASAPPVQPTHQQVAAKPLVTPAALPMNAAAPTAAASPATSKTAPATGGITRERVIEHLLKVVSDRTGYPPEMLDIDSDLEADLGIDSIKRIEILGTLQNNSLLGGGSGDADMEVLAKLKTLRAIADWIVGKSGAAAGSPSTNGAAAAAPATNGAAPAAEHPVPRMLLQVVERPTRTTSVAALKGKILIIGDDDEASRAAAKAVESAGAAAVVIAVERLLSNGAEGARETLLNVRQANGPFTGLIFVAGETANRAASVATAIESEALAFFQALQLLESDLRQARGRVIVLAQMDGVLGTTGATGNAVLIGAALGGIVKSAAREWPEVSCRIVDLGAGVNVPLFERIVGAELSESEGPAEVGYVNGRRVVLQPTITTAASTAAPTKLEVGSVILLTGGARGITAEIAVELAQRFKPTLVLVGRSALPPDAESKTTADISDPKQLKAILRQQVEQAGEKATPARVEAAYARLMQDRDIRSTLAAIRATGAKFEYHPLDVADAAAFGARIDEVYARHGRVDGVIHGAGVTEDKLIRDKTVESFRRVLAPKVSATMTLASKLRGETLKFLAFFSSVSARYGNRGQADYAAANEVLNKLAQQLNHRWPGRIVSLNWGPWESSGGMVSAELAKQFAKAGIVMISRPAGRKLFIDELLHGGKGDVEVVFGGPLNVGEPAAQEHTGSDTPLPTGEFAPTSHEYPLLNARATRISPGAAATEVTQILDPTYDLYLLDHQIDGKPVMPMAMSLELLAEIAANVAPGMTLSAVRELRVLRGITLEHGQAQMLRITATPASLPSGESTVTLRAETVGERPHVCYTANAELVHVTRPGSVPARITLTNPRPLGLTVDEAYERWLFHGPLFAGIVEVEAVGDNGIIAKLAPSSPRRCLAEGNGSCWLIDPVVVDSGLQLLILWARTYLDMTPLPSRLGCYHRTAPAAKGDLRCEVLIQSAGSGPAIHADLMFYDASGMLVGWLEDMEVTCSKALNRLGEMRAGAGAKS